MEEITSRSNPLMTHIRKLTGSRKLRREAGEMVCEGPKMLREALLWGAEITVILETEETPSLPELPAGVRRVRVPRDLLHAVADTQTPQDLLFLCRYPAMELPERLPGSRYLVLDGLQDPGNVGTIWRTADAFGAEGLILLPGCADPWSPKTLRGSMGACFRLPLWEASLPELQKRLERDALPLWATALREGAEDLRRVSLKRGAVVIGSEGRGVSPEVLAACGRTLKIPMRDRCESLNAATAAAVILWVMSAED